MPSDGRKTRDRIILKSRELILKNGYSATSIDNIIALTGVTKGAFFYHFKSKLDLAKAVLLDFAHEDMSHLEDALQKSKKNSKDPLERVILFIDEFINMMSRATDPMPGCLYASYTYEASQFNAEINSILLDTILRWRSSLEELFEDVLKEYSLVKNINIKALSDLPVVIFEGAFVIEKASNQPQHTTEQLKLLRTFIELLFHKEWRSSSSS